MTAAFRPHPLCCCSDLLARFCAFRLRMKYALSPFMLHSLRCSVALLNRPSLSVFWAAPRRILAIVLAAMLTGGKQLQILAGIVGSVAITMMNMLPRLKQAAEFSFNNKPVFVDISLGRLRMIWCKNQHIPSTVDASRKFRSRTKLSARVVPMHVKSRIPNIFINAWHVRLGNDCLLTAPAQAQSVSWVIWWRRRAWPGFTLSAFGGDGVHLMARNKIEWIATWLSHKFTTTTTRANRHMPIIYQIGAI